MNGQEEIFIFRLLKFDGLLGGVEVKKSKFKMELLPSRLIKDFDMGVNNTVVQK